MEEWSDWEKVAVSLARQAGALVLETLRGDKTITVKSSDVDLVTETDKKSEELIIRGIKQAFPTHNVIGEESFSASGALSYAFSSDQPNWLIDPVDGTTNFVHGFPYCCVSIGIAVGTQPVVGVVFNPATDELFSAVQGKGAFLNGKLIRVSPCSSVSQAAVITEFGYAREPAQVGLIFRRLESLLAKRAQCIRCLGSAALNLCYGKIGLL
jgi:inositol-phosphate phosphatase/L-galactose 1-phosphate phosphatase